jgi:Na+/melibiose symporter-like transporter
VRSPLYDLHVAGRRVFWVAAAAGIIVFGSLMGALFVGQQFQQNVLGYSTFESGLTMLPAAFFMILVAPRSAKLINTHGSRTTLLTGYLFAFLAFLTMLLLWNDGSSLWVVILGYSFMGVGVGFAGTPASHSLTGSVPVTRAGMASGTADLQRDLGGAILQSVFGALLTAGYTTAITAAIASAPNASKVSDDTLNELTRSYNGAVAVAEEYPQYSEQIIQAAKESFLKGDRWAYFAGTMAVLLGAAVIFFLFPKKDAEAKLLAGYQAEDTAARAAARDDEPESAAPGSPSRSAGGGSPSRSAGGGSPS